MNIKDLKDSKYLKKEDVGNGALFTISGGTMANVALEGQPKDERFCLHFEEVEKPLILNSTNALIMSAIFGSQETDDWIGQRVVLYSDPNISYQGKLVGGIRARAPRGQAAVKAAMAAPKPAPTPTPEPQPGDSDIPF